MEGKQHLAWEVWEEQGSLICLVAICAARAPPIFASRAALHRPGPTGWMAHHPWRRECHRYQVLLGGFQVGTGTVPMS